MYVITYCGEVRRPRDPQPADIFSVLGVMLGLFFALGHFLGAFGASGCVCCRFTTISARLGTVLGWFREGFGEPNTGKFDSKSMFFKTRKFSSIFCSFLLFVAMRALSVMSIKHSKNCGFVASQACRQCLLVASHHDGKHA